MMGLLRYKDDNNKTNNYIIIDVYRWNIHIQIHLNR